MESIAKCKILLVEDDKTDVIAIQRALQFLGVFDKLEVKSNGEDAIEYLKNNEKPSIIILDLKMSGMDGIQFLKVIRNDQKLKSIPVVVLTASSNAFDKMESFKHNIAGYFIKPLDYFSLAEVIYSYWSKSELPYVERR